MSALEPPIPSEIWERMLAFLRAGKTGRIELFAIEGHVVDASIAERIRGQRAKKRGRTEPGRAEATGS